jgi:rubrerythrin
MKNFNDNNEILDFAIKNEQISIDFYTKLSKKVSDKQIQNLFEEFERHRKKKT